MDIKTAAKKTYGCYVGTVSKVMYPVSYVASIASDIVIKATAFNFLMSIPLRASSAYHSKKDLTSKALMLFNINTEKDYIKQASVGAAVATTFFDSTQRNKLFSEAQKSAKNDELNVEYVLCIDGWICPTGDQYGPIDWLYDQIF